MTKFLAGLVACFVAFAGFYALASRNSSGTMAAANGPYIAGTTISVSQVNNRFADIENEITDSLSRSGKGGMTAALKGPDGTAAAPSFSFTSDPDTGLYHVGANDFAASAGSTKVQEWTATGTSITGTVAATQASAATVDMLTLFDSTLGNGNLAAIRLGKANTGSSDAAAFYYKANATAALSTGCLAVSGQNDTLCVDGNGKTSTAGALATGGGLTIGASGTPISGSFAGSISFVPGSIAAGSSNGTSITLTGAAAGAPCVIGTPTPNPNLVLTCYVTANSCNILLGNPSAGSLTGTSGTYSCRVWNP